MADDQGDLVALRTLKLPPAELSRVRAELDVRFGERGEGAPRMAYRVPEGIGLCVTQVDGHVIAYQVDPVNLCKTGLAVLHGNFLYDNTPCLARLVTVDGEFFSVTGHIVRSECISAPIHLLGIQFNQEIDVRDFIAPAALQGTDCENAPTVASTDQPAQANPETASPAGSEPATATSLEMELALLQNALRDLGSLIQSGARTEKIQDYYAQVAQQFGIPQPAQAPHP